MKRNLEIQIDIKKIDDEKGFEIGNSIVSIMLKVGGRYNHSRQIIEVPKWPQLFGCDFFKILHKCKEYLTMKNIDGCYAFEIDSLDNEKASEWNAIKGIASSYETKSLVMLKDGNYNNILNYISENEIEFNILSNKNNGIGIHIGEYYTEVEQN